ncbi:ADP-forming succinate--CoA ligase subunit beta [Pseudoscardovia suis]|jgi:succinyl-CoA synthetase beta subunit
MDLYEYQGRQLFEEEGIPVPKGIYAMTPQEARKAADSIGYPCVIKGQAKIGHRGQAGAVKIAHDADEAEKLAAQILPMSVRGHKVNGVLVCEAAHIIHEYYVSISVDRTSRDYDVLATAAGGTEVEDIARQHPEYVKRLHIDPYKGFTLDDAKVMAEQIGFYHADNDQAAQILLKMWKVFSDSDATLVEINPLAKVGDPDDESSKSLCALDSKVSLDGNAAFRHDGWKRFADTAPADPLEERAQQHGLHYVRLKGQVGVIGNGAGLVMSSLDAVAGAAQDQGTDIKPANFLDIGGGASAEVMAECLSIVLDDPNVKDVFVNVYGGITSCQLVAEGILEALDKLNTTAPIIIRFDGNAAKEGLETLKAANRPNIIVESTMEQAAAAAARIAASMEGNGNTQEENR